MLHIDKVSKSIEDMGCYESSNLEMWKGYKTGSHIVVHDYVFEFNTYFTIYFAGNPNSEVKGDLVNCNNNFDDLTIK